MSILAIKSTLLPEQISWSVDFDEDYDSDDWDEIDEWLSEQAEEVSALIEKHPKAAFVVDFDAEPDPLLRDFYKQYLGGDGPGHHRFNDALYVFGKLAEFYGGEKDKLFAALYYKDNHDSDEYSVMRFVENYKDSTSCTINYSEDEVVAAREHLREALSYSLVELLEDHGILVQAADRYKDGKYVIGGYTGYINWDNQDEDF